MKVEDRHMQEAERLYRDLMTTCERWSKEDAANDIPAIATALRKAEAREREECAKVAQCELGGYLCPYGRDKPGDPTWGHRDEDICPVCRCNGEQASRGCHDNVQSRIAAAIRARSKP